MLLLQPILSGDLAVVGVFMVAKHKYMLVQITGLLYSSALNIAVEHPV